MMKLVDYHVHSNHSCDGRSTIFEMSQRAIELGIVEIGFSEHMDFHPKDEGYGYFNYEKYISEIVRAQELFKDKLVIRKGIEIDYQYIFEDEIRKWLEEKEFDFIIGSVHYANNEFITHELLKSEDLGEIYRAYFNEVIHSVKSCLFDVVGHLDVVTTYFDNEIPELKRFNYKKCITKVLTEILDKKMYLEINTKLSILKGTSISMIPKKEIVKEYIEMEGKLISVGSDAHSIEEIGSGLKNVIGFLEGYKGKRVKLLFEKS